jgi:hypothetical protein
MKPTQKALQHIREAIKLLKESEDGELALGGELPMNPAPTINEALIHILTGLYDLLKHDRI